jgi:hypothetical protein
MMAFGLVAPASAAAVCPCSLFAPPTTPVGANTAPTLSVSNGTITWTGQGSGVSDYKGATSNLFRGQPVRTTTYTDLGPNASSWTPPTPACGVTRLLRGGD